MSLDIQPSSPTTPTSTLRDLPTSTSNNETLNLTTNLPTTSLPQYNINGATAGSIAPPQSTLQQNQIASLVVSYNMGKITAAHLSSNINNILGI